MPQRRIAILLLVVFIDLFGYSLILPLLPFYAETFGASAGAIGLLVAAYAAAQLVATPVLGRLSDRYGRRPILIFSFTGTFLSFVLLGLARALWVLYAARLLDGLTSGDIAAAQAYIADITAPQDRARGLGYIGAAFGFGFIIGPAVGGLLAIYGFAVPAFAAAGVAAVGVVALVFFLPESLTPERRAELARSPRAGLSLSLLRQALGRPLIRPLLELRFVSGLGVALFQSIFALYALLRFGETAQTVGFIFTYVGILIVLVQGVAIGWLTARIDERRLIVGVLPILVLGLVGWALAPNLPIVLLALAPLALSFGVLNTVLNSVLSKSVPPEDFGGILGLSAAAFTVAQIVAPSAGGFLLQAFGTAAPGLVGAAVVLAILPYAWRQLLARRP